ncbi:hypothetical protein GGR53DRAFT_468645 [Hypoxylon sp. FL1150]|nr:hypothetical protein GGR53DRAFT_468645 [Hypoxylon sp. FL1150]
MDDTQRSMLYNQQIKELYARSTRRLDRRVARSANELRGGIQTLQQHDDRAAELRKHSEENFVRIKRRVDARFGRGDQDAAVLAAGLEQLDVDAAEEEAQLDREFEDLWSHSTEEPPTDMPPLPVPLPTLETLANELLITITQQLDGPNMLNLATTLPHLFMSDTKIHVIHLDAINIQQGLPRSNEHPLLVHAIISGYSLTEISKWLDIYSLEEYCGGDFINRSIPNSPYLLEAAIRVSRPDVVEFLVGRGASLTFGPGSAYLEAFVALKRRIHDLDAPWGHDALIDKAAYILVMLEIMGLDTFTDADRVGRVISHYSIYGEAGAGEYYMRVFRCLVDAVMGRNVSDPTRQLLETALPRIVEQLSDSPGATDWTSREVPGSLMEMNTMSDLLRADDAMRFLIIRHGANVGAVQVANTALINARAANVMLEAIEKRDGNTNIFFDLLQNGYVPLARLENYILEFLLPLIDSWPAQGMDIYGRLLYLAIRDRNDSIASRLLSRSQLPSRQVVYLAISTNNFVLLNKLNSMITRSTRKPASYHDLPIVTDPVVERHDDIDKLIKVCPYPLDVAAEFHNYAMLRYILHEERNRSRGCISGVHVRELLEALTIYSSFATVEEYAAHLDSRRGPALTDLPGLAAGIVPVDFSALLDCAQVLLPKHAALIAEVAGFLLSNGVVLA